MPGLGDALNHVYWLGGASGAGKSTIARRLAAAHDMVLYSSDETMADHAGRCSPEQCPLLEQFKQMSMDERWVERSPEVMLDTFHWFNGEGFHLILEDLSALPKKRRIIVEGFRLLPDLVKPLLANSGQALWLIPTKEFRRSAFTSRGTLWDIPNKTSRPEIALQNLLERDHMFAQRLTGQISAEGLSSIIVDGTASQDALLAQVEARFQLRDQPRVL